MRILCLIMYPIFKNVLFGICRIYIDYILPLLPLQILQNPCYFPLHKVCLIFTHKSHSSIWNTHIVVGVQPTPVVCSTHRNNVLKANLLSFLKNLFTATNSSQIKVKMLKGFILYRQSELFWAYEWSDPVKSRKW